MGTFNGLNKGVELIGGISSTLMGFNEQLLEFSPDWVLLKLSLVVWERFELSDKLDSEFELSDWVLQDGLPVQSTSFQGVFSKVFRISCFGEEDEGWMAIKGWMETVVSFARILRHNFYLVAQ